MYRSHPRGPVAVSFAPHLTPPLAFPPAKAHLPPTGSAPRILRGPPLMPRRPLRPPGSDPPGNGRAEPPAQRIPDMAKGRNKGNKEAKKPKREVPKVVTVASTPSTRDTPTIAGKKVK